MKSVRFRVAGAISSIAYLSSIFLSSQGAIAAAKPWRILPKLPSRGAPGTNGSGASRPSCPSGPKPMVVLASTSSNWGETIDAHPTFWFYQPYQGVAVQLDLRDENTQSVVFSSTYKVKGDAGIAKLTLPETAPTLEVDKLYRWQVSFVCDANSQQAYIAKGVIVRRKLSASLNCKLQRAKPEERASIFAQQGLWYNVLNEMATLRRLKPKDPDVQANWRILLTDPEIQLDNWVSEPLIEQ
ncbi:MAG: DUF928 domain-containing protein [Alkalinema sp. RU_4_3]|nr:DUF928 domain-containing protein [Alkalinema sp. RU_4_3]